MLDVFIIQAINTQENHAVIGGSPCATCSDKIYDCEDYAVAKLDRLIAFGANPADARFVIYDLPDGRRHIVLSYRKKVLDNLSDSLLTPELVKRRGYVKIVEIERMGR